ncbi:adhesion G-protein coupled receptor G6-like isoform X2 [Oscarella lobularis]|uniref:adhesion G-protein coupled receptor G6-like isoform X2 n=1 Tax=Oscarella lobularis TaxID=121494 RepID=UPI003313F813
MSASVGLIVRVAVVCVALATLCLSQQRRPPPGPSSGAQVYSTSPSSATPNKSGYTQSPSMKRSNRPTPLPRNSSASDRPGGTRTPPDSQQPAGPLTPPGPQKQPGSQQPKSPGSQQPPGPQNPGPQQPQQPPGRSCPRGQTVDGKGVFRWPLARIDSTVRVPCPSKKRGEIAFRTCRQQGWLKPNTSACSYLSGVSQGLDGLLADVEAGKPQAVASSLRSLFSHPPMDLSPQDVALASTLFDDVLDLGPPDIETATNLFGAASELLRGGRELLRRGNAATKSSQNLIRGIEKATREYPLPVNPPFPVIDEDSLIADLFDISPRNFKGFSFYETRTQGRFGRRDGQGSLLNDDVSVGIELPESLLSSFGDEDVRINLLLYNSSDLFQDLQLPAGRVENNTKVVGCFVNNVSLENLQDPVKMIFTSFQAAYAPQCVYWDEWANDGYGGWSSDGCEVVESNSTTVVCSCNHLTSFSVLFTLCGEGCPCKSVSDSALSVISYIGCALSILGLLVTLVCLPILKCRRKNRNPMLNSTHIIFNFCISLLLSLIVFLTIRPAASSSYGGCTTTALLLHFFLMSTFLWTLMEGISMYRDFVIAIGVNTSSETFLKVAYFVSYGIPALIVAVLLSIQLATKSTSSAEPSIANYTTNVSTATEYEYFSGDYYIYDTSTLYDYYNDDDAPTTISANVTQGGVEIYGSIDVFRDDDTIEKDVSYCWVKNNGVFLGTFAIPALIIVIFNLSITIRIYFVLKRSAKMKTKTRKARSQEKSRARAMILVSSLLGLTWLFGVLTLVDFQSFLPKATSPNSAVCSLGTTFHYIFAILNSLQGFCILLFYIVLNHKVRKQLSSYCCPTRYSSVKMTNNTSGTSLQTVSTNISTESLDN